MKLRLRNAAITIVIINIILFVMQNLIKGFTESLMLISQDVLARPWILISSMFMHANLSHLLFNMYVLFMFGPLIEQKIGTKRFLFAYFGAGILAAVASVFFYPRALGASGAIMGILGITIMLMPHLRVLLFFVIPVSLRTAGIIFAAIDIIGIFNPGSNIANIAHLAGLTVGLAYGFYLIKQKKSFAKRFVVVKHPKHNRNKTYTDSKNSSQIYDVNNKIEMSKEDIDEYIKYGRL